MSRSERTAAASSVARGAATRSARAVFRRMLGARPAVTSGVITTPGLADLVTIRRDRWGIPHIDANSDADGWFGLGFAMGQDRAFQVDLLSRVAAGEVAALIGPDGLEIDRLARRIGFRRAAALQWDHLDAELQAGATAFCDGITRGATLGLTAKPHEYALLRRAPRPFTVTDLLSIFKLNAFLLASNWETELVRLQVLVRDGEHALLDLDPTSGPALPAPHLPVTSPTGAAAGEAAARLADDLAALRDHLGVGSSNNWVLSGDRTASGRPLVANDPHLPGLLPSLWYLAHITTPDWSVAGATFVATPGFATAHNGHGAWGTTSAHTDNTDLFLEQVRGTQVRDRDAWIAAEVHREVIEVRGRADVIEEVLVTPRGPIVSPALEDVEDGLPRFGGVTTALSLAGTWLDAAPLVGFTRAVKARDVQAFRACFADWPTMQLNVVWADTSGTIGWQVVGDLPVRRSGNGTVPMPGWLPDVGWDGRVSFEDMPHAIDPPGGLLATANNQPTVDGDTPYLGADFLDGYRLASILDAIGDRDDWDVASTLDLQRDTRCLPWRDLRETVLGLDVSRDADATLALHLLTGWDGDLAADRVGATVYELWHAELAERIVRAKAPNTATWLLGRSSTALTDHALPALRRTSHLIHLVTTQPVGWFERGWEVELVDVLATVVRRLRDDRGGDPTAWAWGEVRTLTLHNLVAESNPALRPILDRGPYPCGGDSHTIPQASPPALDPTGNPIAIASARMVVDVGNWEASRWVLPGGQSGNPCSPHYDDQIPLWLAGDAVPIAFSDDAVLRATTTVLRLAPLQ